MENVVDDKSIQSTSSEPTKEKKEKKAAPEDRLSATDKIAAFFTSQAGMKKQLVELESQVSALTVERDEAIAAQSEAEESVSQLEGKVSSLEAERADLLTRLEKAAIDVDKLKTEQKSADELAMERIAELGLTQDDLPEVLNDEQSGSILDRYEAIEDSKERKAFYKENAEALKKARAERLSKK